MDNGEFELKDYEFRDENGNIYISTPEYNPTIDLINLLALACTLMSVLPLLLRAYLGIWNYK